MKTILILMDTLNRRMLKPYTPDTWVQTPNINRLAASSLVCDQHWSGSLPCMPARRDLFTGRMNFLERNWGPIEPYDVTFPQKLRENGVFTHMVTDHYHYFEIGGENYCQQFNTWELIRGQESDPWISRVDQPALPEQFYGQVRQQYEWNRTQFKTDADYPSPQTFEAACEWLRNNEGADQYFLMVEAFDPHEPFDCPQEFLDLYEDEYNGPRFDWPHYRNTEEPDEAMEHLRKRYAATLTMNDRWLGKLLDTLQALNLFDDTLILLTTDHGFLLNEHGFTGKNVPPIYNELAHIPLMVHLPGGKRAGERCSALSQTADLMPTILDYYNISVPDSLHGHSLKSVWEGKQEKVRETALYGYHGRAVNLTDGKHTYMRAPLPENKPCYHYCVIPSTFLRYMGNLEEEQDIISDYFLSNSQYPVLRIPAQGDNLDLIKETMLFDLRVDYEQLHPIGDETLLREWENKLVEVMKQHDAPEEQFERLGLKG